MQVGDLERDMGIWKWNWPATLRNGLFKGIKLGKVGLKRREITLKSEGNIKEIRKKGYL